MITTVGDQIFALTQEIKKLKKQNQRYETVLRDIVSENGSAGSPAQGNVVSRAREALSEGLSVSGK